MPQRGPITARGYLKKATGAFKNISAFLPITLVIILIVPLLSAAPRDMKLNQFFIATKEISRGISSFSQTVTAMKSYYSFGINNLFTQFNSKKVDYNKPKEFFAYIWKRFPSYALVYPTETYYYYDIQLPGKTISGNIRLLDAKDGVIHFGYFDKNNPRATSSDKWVGDISVADGLIIKILSDYKYKVTYQGKAINFILSDFIHKIPNDLVLLPEEEFVSQIMDESGVRFVLIFNKEINSFYFIVNPDEKLSDTLVNLGKNYWLGKDTGFIYYQDTIKLFLIGVFKKNVTNNNYFDGPFDQVPPHLQLREKLYKAYPNTRFRNGGLDEYGNYLEKKDTRVAISPYYQYKNYQELIKRNDVCLKEKEKSKFWKCLTRR
jgi:hypothetical protein